MVASPSLAFIAIDRKAIRQPFHSLPKDYGTGAMLDNEAMTQVFRYPHPTSLLHKHSNQSDHVHIFRCPKFKNFKADFSV